MIRGTDNMDRQVEPQVARRRLPRHAGLALVAVVFAAVAVSAWSAVAPMIRADRSVARDELRLAVVTRGDLERDVSAEGRVVASRRPTLASPAAGAVRLHVQPGEAIEAGQVVATVESPELRSRLEQERSALLGAESELERQALAGREQTLGSARQIELLTVRAEAAERAMDRAQRNFDEGVVNAVEHERARDALRLARLELEHARAQAEIDHQRLAFEHRQQELRVERQRLAVKELDRQVGELEVRSPVAGLLARADVVDGDTVQVGQALASVVDLSALEVEVGIPDTYADEIVIGTEAVLRLGDEEHRASVRRVAPEVEGTLVPVRLAFTEGLPAGLKQSQRVTARLILDARRDVMKLPRGPFLESGGGHRAWVVEGDIAQSRRITIGASSVTEIEITQGLAAGETVILSNTDRFRDAESVLLR